MSDTLNITINARNQASPQIRAVVNSVKELQATAKGFGQAMERAMGGAGGATTGLGGALRSLGSMAQGVLSGMLGAVKNLAGGVMDLAGKVAGSLVGAFHTLASSAAKAAAVVGAVLGGAFLVTAKAGVSMNVALQTAQIGLTAITGSADKARGLINELRTAARQTAPTFKELLPIGQQLAAVYGPAGLGKVVPTIKAFDAAAKVLVGGDKNALDRAFLGFRQLASADAPRTEDLRQIEDNLPGSGVRDILKEQFGTADPETLQQAGVTGAQVADAIVAGFSARFGQVSARMAGSIPIQASSIIDSFNDISASITQVMTGAVGGALGKLSELVSALAGNERFVAALAVPFDLLGKGIEAATQHLPAFVGWLEKTLTKENIINFLAQIGGGVKTMTDEVMKFLRAVTGGSSFTSIWEGFQKAALTAIDFVLKAWGGFSAAVGYVVQNAPALWQAFVDAMEPARAALEVLAGAVTVLLGLLVGQKALQALDVVTRIAGALGAVGKLVAGAVGIGGAAGTAAGGVNLGARLLGGLGTGGLAVGEASMVWPVAAAGAAGWALQEVFDPEAKERRDRLGRAGAAMDFSRKQDAYLANELAARKAGSASLSGPLGDLQRLGRATLGTIGQLGGAALKQIPKSVTDFFAGLAGAARGGAAGAGIAPLLAAQQANASQAARMLNGALGGPGAAAGSDLPGSETSISYDGAGGGGGSVVTTAVAAAGKLSKQLRQHLDDEKALFTSRLEMVRAMIEALPEEEQAAAAARELIPVLLERQQAIQEELPQVRDNLEKYYQLQAEGFRAEREINELRGRAIKSQADQAKKGTDGLRKLADLRIQFEEEQIRAAEDPGTARAMKHDNLVPVLIQKFRMLSRGRSGETAEEMMQRAVEREHTRNDILEAEGLGQKDRRFARLWGGGMLPLFNTKQYGAIMDYLDREAGQNGFTDSLDAATNAGMFAPPVPGAPVPGSRQVIINLPPGASAAQLRDMVLGLLDQELAKVSVAPSGY